MLLANKAVAEQDELDVVDILLLVLKLRDVLMLDVDGLLSK